jgi:5-hydroxyisourate hydrolase
MSQLTTHILDTSRGRPAAGITVVLYRGENDEWTELARAVSNADGRVNNLLDNDSHLEHCIHKLRFETKDYFDNQHVKTLYPFVEIVFDVTDDEHYHVPLLVSPFGYSTYRGS